MSARSPAHGQVGGVLKKPVRSSGQGAAVLIIAGGRGTRFWPLSRASRPKPLFSLDGKTSLLAATIARARAIVRRDRIFVLAAKEQGRPFRAALRAAIPAGNLIIEPEGRGTAVAIAYGAAVIGRRLGNVTIAVMPADHHIAPTSGFRDTIRAAIGLARTRGALVVIGVKPTRAEPGFGYQEIGPRVGAGFKVASFVEKPALRDAQRMVRSGRYLWNAGMFVIGTRVLEGELRAHCPSLAAAIASIMAAPARVQRIYRRLDFDSFDRVIAERSANVLGVRARFRWHDVGSWDGLWEAMRSTPSRSTPSQSTPSRARDGRGGRDNVLSGTVIALGSEGVIARSDRRLMVLMGVEDLVAVDAGDAILIARRSRSQDLRRVTEELKRRGMNRYL